MNKREFLGSGMILFAGSAVSVAAPQPRNPSEAKAHELTFLKSIDPSPDNLARFIVLNWFAMDERAVTQGIISDYAMFVSPDADQDWNVLVNVGYFDPRGYEAVAPQFEAIRRAHVIVPVEGKTLKALGTIVSSRKLVRTVFK